MKKIRKKINATNVETHKYRLEDFQEVMRAINEEISVYRKLYRDNPNFIVISRDLATIFDAQLSLMTQRQGIMILNCKPMEFYSVFGIPCMVSKVLGELEFEVR